VESKATIQPFTIKKIMANNSNEEGTGSEQTLQLTRNKGSNGFYEVPIGAATTKRTVCKDRAWR
jgi:hypothetical protein